MKNTKYIILLSLLAVASLFLIGGSSYALLKGNFVSDNKHVITTGNVSVSLNEKFENITRGINVQNDVTAILDNEFYEFSVTNTGMSKVKYKVYLINEKKDNAKLIPIEYAKVGLEVNGEEIGPISLDLTKGVIDDNKLDLKETVNYKMRLWFDESKKSEIKNLGNAKLYLKLKVVAEQIVE